VNLLIPIVASLILFGVYLHESRRYRAGQLLVALTLPLRGAVKAARILTGGAR
jgi:hypothetical protein